jgi:hypothetical protein
MWFDNAEGTMQFGRQLRKAMQMRSATAMTLNMGFIGRAGKRPKEGPEAREGEDT